MAGEHPPSDGELRDQEDARQESSVQSGRDEDDLSDLRLQAVKLFLVLSFFVTVIDPVARLFKDPTFHVDPVVFGMVYGTTLALLGIEGFARLLGGGK